MAHIQATFIPCQNFKEMLTMFTLFSFEPLKITYLNLLSLSDNTRSSSSFGCEVPQHLCSSHCTTRRRQILPAVPLPLCLTSGALVSAAAPWARGVRVPVPMPPTAEKWEHFCTQQIQPLKSVWGSGSLHNRGIGILTAGELLCCTAFHFLKKG